MKIMVVSLLMRSQLMRNRENGLLVEGSDFANDRDDRLYDNANLFDCKTTRSMIL